MTSFKPMFTAFPEPVATLRSYARSFVCLLLKPKSAWNPKRCPLVKFVLASVDVRITFFFKPKVDKGVSAWFLITREVSLWKVVGLHTSSSMCETLFRRGYNLLSICRSFPWWAVGKFSSGALGRYFGDIIISWMLI